MTLAVFGAMTLRRWIAPLLGTATLLVSGAALADVVAFDAGLEHACAIDGCGEVLCWGYNGQFNELDSYSGDFVDVAVGMDHNCVLDPSGTVECWGRSDDDRLEPPHDDFIDIEAGGAFTCGIRAGSEEIVCWGRGEEDPDLPQGASATDGPPTGVHYRMMSLGYDYGCAITTGRSVLHCWGDSTPLGVRELWFDEVMLDANEKFATVSAGGSHVCFTSTRDRVYCFGDDAANQLMPDHENPSKPNYPGAPAGQSYEVGPLEKSRILGNWFNAFGGVTWGGVQSLLVDDVSAGLIGTCAVYRNGPNASPKTYCWGYPFQYGYGRSIQPGVDPEEVLLGGHQFCVWDHDNGGSVGCEWEFPAYATMPERQVPDLSCG